MTRENIRKRIARNINQLGDDEDTFVDGIVTEDAANEAIDDVYRQELFPILSDKFPQQFYQTSYPQSTYTATGTVSTDSTSTTLVATAAIFTNDMEGFTVENITDDETAVISTYTNSTTVTLDTEIDDDWDGDTIYVLGNEYTFGGDSTDIKEIVRVGVKYASGDDYFKVCEPRDKEDAILVGNESFSKSAPLWYQATIDVDGDPMTGVGILPFPDSYAGKFEVTYVERPPELAEDTDEPRINIPGINELIVFGATAKLLRMQGNYEESTHYEALFENRLAKLISSYKPKSRSGPTKVRWSNVMESQMKRQV